MANTTGELLTESTKREYRSKRLMATIAAFGMMVTVSTVTATGFTVAPGMERFDVGAGTYLIWYSIFTLAVAAVNSFSGSLISRYGVRKVASVGSIGTAVSYLGMGFAPNLIVFYMLAAVLGVSFTGCTYLMSTHLTTAWHTHDRRGTVVGIVAMGVAVGGFLWGLIFPPVIEQYGFTGAFVTIAIAVSIFTVLPALFLVREPVIEDLDPATTKSKAERKGLLTGYVGITVLLGIAFFLFAFESAFVSVQPAVYANLGADATTAGLLLSVYATSGLIAKPVLGYMYDRFGVFTLFVILVILFLLGLPLIAVFGGLGGGILFALVPVAALSLSVPTIILPLITVRTVGQARFPLVYGIALSIWSLGLATAGPLWGYTLDVTGTYTVALFAAGGLGIVGIIFTFFAYRLGTRIRESEEAMLLTSSGPEVVGRTG
ncbi:MFS transporter [Rhodococcus fascians]|nr:MFS transporter [Rhodococcus fascians]MBY4114668.1 MFS transporter [Rhodococcus fascians]